MILVLHVSWLIFSKTTRATIHRLKDKRVVITRNVRMVHPTTWRQNFSLRKGSSVSSQTFGLLVAYSLKWPLDLHPLELKDWINWYLKFLTQPHPQLKTSLPFSMICLGAVFKKIQSKEFHGSIFVNTHSGLKKSMVANCLVNQHLTNIWKGREESIQMILLSSKRVKAILFQT